MDTKHNQIQIELGEIDDSCFVVMPFNSQFKTQYDKVIRPAVEAAGLSCVRGDEIFARARIVDDIWRSIRRSRIVIAELTGRNPNVLYEVGLAHAVAKPVIVITRNEEDVPFDLKALRYLYYDTNDPFWGANLQTALRTMIKNAITEDGLTRYLEDISIVGELALPEVTPEPASVRRRKGAVLEVSGSWSAKWVNGEVDHVGILDIAQDDSDLIATLTVTFRLGDESAVVRESLVGSVENGRIDLGGVNYTYLERASATEYRLSRFDLKPSKDGCELRGSITDDYGPSDVVFSKA